MKNKFSYGLLFILSLLLFFSCKNDKDYRVHSAFTEYVNRFEKEAAQRGRNFDFKSSGLIMEFADLKDNIAGLCHYEKPIRIEIDQSYWEKMQKYAGADLISEELVFHELGHGFLNRKHLNTFFENDEWKSLMCGGDSIPGKTWNINYRGVRRNYYLDELFNQNTPTPEFINTTLPIDTSGYTNVYFEDFNSLSPKFWDPTNYNFDNGLLTLQNGELKFESQSTLNLVVVSKFSSINIQDDFCFEFTFRNEGSNPKSRFGLAFGDSDASLDYFLINNLQEMIFGNNKWFSYFTKLTNQNIIPKNKNHLKILKNKEMIYFFINGAYVYCTEMESKENNLHFGFMVSASETLYLDNFGLGAKFTTSRNNIQQKTIRNSTFEMKVSEIEVPENNFHK